MKNHLFLKTPAELLALAGHITFKFHDMYKLLDQVLFGSSSVWFLSKILSIILFMANLSSPFGIDKDTVKYPPPPPSEGSE